MTSLVPRQMEVAYPLDNYLKDHHIDGQPVLPAAEALRFMTTQVRDHYPQIDANRMTDIEFARLLPFKPEKQHINVVIDFKPEPTGALKADLTTLFVSKKAGIKRPITHVKATFGVTHITPNHTPAPVPVHSKAEPFFVSPQQLYRELVPLGPAFQNVAGDIAIRPETARALLKAPPSNAPQENEPAATFVLDAAFHVACAWGQRYREIVAYPVALAERNIYKPVSSGAFYQAIVTPRSHHPTVLNFDIEIRDLQNELCETITGLEMRVLPQTANLRPPKWLRVSP
jgi:hypothetical protein